MPLCSQLTWRAPPTTNDCERPWPRNELPNANLRTIRLAGQIGNRPRAAKPRRSKFVAAEVRSANQNGAHKRSHRVDANGRTTSQVTTRDPRLQKVLAAAGYGSRRACEELILEGRVEIDREICVELGTRVDLATQMVRVDGTVIKAPRMRYFLLNKPVGVVSTARDPWARMRVIDLIDSEERVFTVGRLDKASSGLMLVTNDGELANQLAHPRYGVTKTYQATVAGKPSAETIAKLRKGIHLAEAVARVVSVKLKKAHPQKSVLEIVLSEGRNREIRRMLARVGHKVLQLKRTEMGTIKLGEIPAGAYRELTREEVKKLRQASGPKPRKKKPHSARADTTTASVRKAHDKRSEKKPTRSKSIEANFPTYKKGERFSGSVLGDDAGTKTKKEDHQEKEDQTPNPAETTLVLCGS